MRPSPFRHVLAVLRTFLGLTQKEMAGLLDCSTATIQAIELGKLNLSERLAGLIALRTGVAVSWLLQNNTSNPPVSDDEGPYSREVFEQARAFDTANAAPAHRILQPTISFHSSICRLAIILIKAHKDRKTQLCAYKIAKALDDLEHAFGVAQADKDFFGGFFHADYASLTGKARSIGNAASHALEEAVRILSPEYTGLDSIKGTTQFFVTDDGQITSVPPKLGEKAKRALAKKKTAPRKR